MDEKTVFLTEKDIDKKLLIKTLEEFSSTIKTDEDIIILKNILFDFNKGDFSLLTPQEVHFLSNSPNSVWCEYFIFRYKY